MARQPTLRAVPRLHAAGLVALLAALGATGCSSECRDVDADGYGPSCARGPDCDDRNPLRNVDCVAVPAPDCVANPRTPGCACFPSTTATCYAAAPSTIGVGACKAGVIACVTDFYGLCYGAVEPGAEVCNGLDDDCDGEVDDGVVSPCGGCDASCPGEVWGAFGAPFVPGAGLVTTTRGHLELDRSTPRFDGVWIANSGEDTVSHVSAATATEVARHESGGDDPSRVAVDYRGDVFVANRAFGAVGTLTKLAGGASACVDRDLSGTIETSIGPGDVPSLVDDECVLFSVAVGGLDEVPRALAVDGAVGPSGTGGGDVWVGLHGGEAVLHVDGETGATLERIALPGMRPYAAVFDARGYLYLASQEGELAIVDRRTSPPTVERVLLNLACYTVYGMDVTADGALVLSGHACDQVVRFDPATRALRRVGTLPNPRSLVVHEGRAFAPHTDGRLSILGVDPLAVESVVDLWALGRTPVESLGVTVDSLGYVWVASTQGGGTESVPLGLLTRVDPSTRTVLTQLPVGRAPHTQGDSTGAMLRGSFVPTGATTRVFTGCAAGGDADWRRLHLHADAGAKGSVLVELRHAPTLAELSSASFAALGTLPDTASPWSLAFVPDGAVLELRLTLSSTSRDASPLVRAIGLEYGCVGSVD